MNKIACLFRGSLKPEDRLFGDMGFEIVVDSIKNYLNVKDVVFFMHLWGDPDADKKLYKKYFEKDNLTIDINGNYFNEISNLEKFYVSPSRSDKIIWHDCFSSLGTYERVFAQISSAISLEKVCYKFVNSVDFIDCDAVFITRPDLLFSKRINKRCIEKLNSEKIYFNKHGVDEFAGDSCFLMSKQNVFSFANILSFMKKNPYILSPRCHLWYYYYVKEICKIDIELFEPDISVNCELLRRFNKENIINW